MNKKFRGILPKEYRPLVRTEDDDYSREAFGVIRGHLDALKRSIDVLEVAVEDLRRKSRGEG